MEENCQLCDTGLLRNIVSSFLGVVSLSVSRELGSKSELHKFNYRRHAKGLEIPPLLLLETAVGTFALQSRPRYPKSSFTFPRDSDKNMPQRSESCQKSLHAEGFGLVS